MEPKRSPADFLPQAFLESLSLSAEIKSLTNSQKTEKTEQDFRSWEENDEIAFNKILEPMPNIQMRLDRFQSQRAHDYMSFGNHDSFLMDSSSQQQMI